MGPSLSFGGMDVDLRNGAARRARYQAMEIARLPSKQRVLLHLPDPARCDLPVWSPNGSHLAFTCVSAQQASLWIAQSGSGEVYPIPELEPNLAFGQPCRWLANSEQLVCMLRAAPLSEGGMRLAPLIEDSRTEAAAEPTSSASMASMFSSQVAIIEAKTSASRLLGDPVLARNISPSPRGDLFLVQVISADKTRGYDRWHWRDRAVEVWDESGARVARLESHQDHLERRNVAWREGGANNAPLAITFGELRKASSGDTTSERLVLLEAPFNQPGRTLFQSQGRLTQVASIRDSDLFFVAEYEHSSRRQRAYLLDTKTQVKQSANVTALWDVPLYRFEDSAATWGWRLARALRQRHLLKREQQNRSKLLGATRLEHGSSASASGNCHWEPLLIRSWSLANQAYCCASETATD